FKDESIAEILDGLVSMLRMLIESPAILVAEWSTMMPTTQRELLKKWNQTQRQYQSHKCVVERFEEEAERNGERIAVVWEEERVSYGCLNRRANQLGRRLRGMGVGAEVRVGLCVERSVEMVVGILGIMKAGGAYVALDGKYPEERLGRMVEDAGAAVVV